MKTQKTTSALKKLSALTIKSESNLYPLSKSSIAYKLAIEVINGAKHIRPVYTTGSGRFTSNSDHTYLTMSILSKIGIDYVFTNDAPKGGLTGNLLTIITKLK